MTTPSVLTLTPAPNNTGVAIKLGGLNADAFTLRKILKGKQLQVVLQPILHMSGRHYIGYEALIRGPADSPLHSPAELFAAAHLCNLQRELEHACRAAAIESFAALQKELAVFDYKLFINLSANMLDEPLLMEEDELQSMAALGIRPEQIVIEITENQQVGNFSAFREILARYRRIGYSFAIDDLGEGFSNLRMWSEIRPEYVKIDRHFISGIASDVLKFRLVRAMVDIAEACHATLIAEGIEEESEFATLRDLGIHCGQGYLIARPQAAPEATPPAHILRLLDTAHIAVFPKDVSAQCASVAPLLKRVTPVSPSLDNDAVFALFEADENLHALPVVQGDIPVGMINRHTLIERFARLYRRELYGKRPCALFMDKNPVIVDQDTPVNEVGALLGNGQRHQLYDGFIITERGRYIGIADSQDLMVQITEMQIRSARFANPLTQLPGNVPINEHINRLIRNGGRFVACYADICHFKPYNDIYGYRRGDGVIQLLGNLLSRSCDERIDFIGHIGGDDFVLLMQSEDWQQRCQRGLKDFDQEVLRLVDEEDLQRGGFRGEDREGNPTFHSLPALSIGCIVVEPGLYASHNELSAAMAEAKSQAKRLTENKFFIERRRPALTS